MTLQKWMLYWLLLPTFRFAVCVAYRFADHVYREMTLAADIPPPTAQDPLFTNYWDQSDEILSRCWDSAAGFERIVVIVADRDTDTMIDVGHALNCYGEVTPLGVRQLAHAMDVRSADDVRFYDLGSGVGRLTTQMYFDQPHLIQKAVGIELSLERHEMATEALFTCISNDDPSIPVAFRHGDAVELDWSDATHVFLSSLCFPKLVMESLQDKMLQTPSLQVVSALNRLDRLYLAGWTELEIPIQMSWGPGVVKVYHSMNIEVGNRTVCDEDRKELST